MVKISKKSEAKPLVEKSNEGTVLVGTIPDGIPKSGRKWKIRQTFRSSAQDRQGVSAKLCKTYNARMAEKQKFDEMKALERYNSLLTHSLTHLTVIVQKANERRERVEGERDQRSKRIKTKNPHAK